jgi:hypothetical protein
MDRKNIARGFKKLRVWQDATALYVLACKIFTNFPFELKKVASNSSYAFLTIIPSFLYSIIPLARPGGSGQVVGGQPFSGLVNQMRIRLPRSLRSPRLPRLPSAMSSGRMERRQWRAGRNDQMTVRNIRGSLRAKRSNLNALVSHREFLAN